VVDCIKEGQDIVKALSPLTPGKLAPQMGPTSKFFHAIFIYGLEFYEISR
jgi:hypothetical protein